MERRNKDWIPGRFHNHAKLEGTGKKRSPRTSWGHHSRTMEINAAIRKTEDCKCYNCGRTGHLARDCKKPKKEFCQVPEGKRTANAAIRTDKLLVWVITMTGRKLEELTD